MRTRRTRLSATIAALAATLAVLPFGGARAEAPCTGDGGPGGDWPLYGQALDGNRYQPAEDRIGPATVAKLGPAWVVPGSGNSTPVVEGRCVYAAGGGKVRAWDVETGARVWEAPTGVGDGDPDGTLYGLAVMDGRVHVNVQYVDYPRSLALDANTGARLWTGDPIQFGYEAWQIANAIPFGDMVLQATTGPDADPNARPGYALLDRTTGAVIHKQTTIPVEDLDDGYAGGGIWATPAVDRQSGYAFVGTANPYSKKKEHRYDNAILKIDVREGRSTFGTIVDAYKGNVDQFVPGLDRQPACDMFGETITYHPAEFSLACVQLDIDFGASPNLFRNDKGELLVGELQKSGVYHAAYADTMQQAWTTIVSTLPPATAGNSATSAYDGKQLYVTANGGLLYALDPDNGRINWVAATAVTGYHPLAVANGVVYVRGHEGTLHAHDATTGRQLWVTAPPADARVFCNTFLTSGGIAIARHTVLVNCDGTLIAYRLPEVEPT